MPDLFAFNEAQKALLKEALQDKYVSRTVPMKWYTKTPEEVTSYTIVLEEVVFLLNLLTIPRRYCMDYTTIKLLGGERRLPLIMDCHDYK